MNFIGDIVRDDEEFLTLAVLIFFLLIVAVILGLMVKAAEL